VIGGKHLIVASLQYDYRLFSDWIVETFVDAGNAFNDTGIDHINVGAGFGVKWLSPIGPVYFELAWPMNKEEDDFSFSSVNLNFGFGATISRVH